MTWSITTLEEWNPIAEWILENKKHAVIQLKGEMGAGKTSFTAVLLQKMNAKDEVSSPTYAIVNEYDTERGSVYHFDLYRLKDISELEALGFYEYLDSGNLCIIEWAELFPEAFEGTDYHALEIVEIDGKRNISFS